MSSVALFVVALIVFVPLWHVYGGTLASLALVLGTLTVVSVPVAQFTAASELYRTTAAPYVGLASYQIAILICAAAIPGWQVIKSTNKSLLLMTLGLLSIAVLTNNTPPHVISGLEQWVLVAMAWGVGAAVAHEMSLGHVSERALMVLLFTLTMAQVVAVALQLAGVLSVDVSTLGDGSVSRISGATNHAAQLGKLLLLFLVIVLPLTRSSDALVRRLAYVTIIASTAMIGLTYSRANMLALAVMLAIWFVVGSGSSFVSRIAMPIVALLVVLPTLGTLFLREKLDSEGGSRPELTAAALEQLGRSFWWGVGPNNYLPVVGQFDRLAAHGLPVHNSALLALIELGAVMFALLAVPVLAMFLQAVKNLRRTSPARLLSISVLASSPGLAVVILTGQGMTVPDMLPLFMLVWGYCWRTFKTAAEGRASSESAAETVQPAPRRRPRVAQAVRSA